MNLCFLDIETTGLDPQKHEIVSIGAVLENGETFEVKVHPMRIRDADPVALRINGYNKKDWEDAFLLPHALKLLSDFAKGTTLIAYNVSFDWAFIEEAYKDYNLLNPFPYAKLDLLTFVWDRHWNRTAITSLKNTCMSLRIDPEPEVHTALNGAMKAWEVYKRLV